MIVCVPLIHANGKHSTSCAHEDHTRVTSTTTTTSSPDETETSSEGFQYQSVRRVKTEPSAPMSSGSSDEIRAMSDGMFEILKYKIKDLDSAYLIIFLIMWISVFL